MAYQSPVTSETSRSKSRAPFLSATPMLYILLLLCSALGTFGYKLRSDGIFACGADGYSGDRFLAYCNSTAYGDYDHGAFWYGLEPDAQRNAIEAEVLFMGSSRMQFAFSTEATAEWFSSPTVRYYLLGFSHTENIVFFAPLLLKLKPRARVYVINVDRFFDDRVTPPAHDIQRETKAQSGYPEKRFWQSLHKPICNTLPAICGARASFFRLRETGAWQFSGSDGLKPQSVADGPPSNPERWSQYAALGEKFISQLPVDRKCIFLTIAPSAETRRAEATAIATALGFDLVATDPDGLQTFDGSHLDRASAERWSRAFFQAAGPRIRRCLESYRPAF